MRKKTKNPLNKNPIIIVIMILLAVYALSMLVVLAWGLMISFKNYPKDINGLNNPVPDFLSFPSIKLSSGEMFNFWNYQRVFENVTAFKHKASYYSAGSLQTPSVMGNYWVYIYNTILYTGVGTLILSVVPAIGAYMCAKYKYKFSTVIYSIVVFVMVMPIVGNAPAMLDFLRKIGFYDTYVGHAIRQCSFTSMYFLVFYAFFSGMSDSYMEAAQMDGASQLRVMLSIATPLAKNFITTVALVLFVACWNDYETPILYLPTKPNLAFGVHYMCTRGAGFLDRVPFRVASLMTLAIPSLILYIALNDKLMGNISLGGIKE